MRKRTCFVLCCFLFVNVLLWSDEPLPRPLVGPNNLGIQFIGNEAVLITDGKTTLLSDYPYQSGYSIYMEYDAAKVRPVGDVLCLITHGHGDHFEPALFQKTNWKIIAPDDVASKLDPSRVVGSGLTRTFKDIKIEAIKTPHARIGHYSYLVSWHGKRFYFTGDTESIDALIAAKDLDVAFVSPWLLDAVLSSGKKIDAEIILIYHQATNEKTPTCDRCKVLKQYESLPPVTLPR
jgi:glyoxylase-like metal-dependent hydrolase (beta-lactamase superfamily II)